MTSHRWTLPEPTSNVAAGADQGASLTRPITTGELVFCLGFYADKFKRFRSAHQDFLRGRMEWNRILYDVPAVRAWLVSKGFDVKLFDVRTAQILARPGLSGILCAGPGFHHAVTKRSSNMMAN